MSGEEASIAFLARGRCSAIAYEQRDTAILAQPTELPRRAIRRKDEPSDALGRCECDQARACCFSLNVAKTANR